jgi:hypothetical protein
MRNGTDMGLKCKTERNLTPAGFNLTPAGFDTHLPKAISLANDSFIWLFVIFTQNVWKFWSEFKVHEFQNGVSVYLSIVSLSK